MGLTMTYSSPAVPRAPSLTDFFRELAKKQFREKSRIVSAVAAAPLQKELRLRKILPSRSGPRVAAKSSYLVAATAHAHGTTALANLVELPQSTVAHGKNPSSQQNFATTISQNRCTHESPFSTARSHRAESSRGLLFNALLTVSREFSSFFKASFDKRKVCDSLKVSWLTYRVSQLCILSSSLTIARTASRLAIAMFTCSSASIAYMLSNAVHFLKCIKSISCEA